MSGAAPDAWRDVGVELADRPGALAELGELVGRSGASLEGGGVFTHAGVGVAHFLVDRPDDAARALRAAGLDPVVSPVVTLRLRQDVPGQLGLAARRMADAGVGIAVQYSDHDHRLVLVVDDLAAATVVAQRWEADRSAHGEQGDRPSSVPG